MLIFFILFQISLASGEMEVWFSPNGGARQQIVHLIQQTTENIDVAIYSFTSKELALSLLAAKESGRKIRLIADNRQSKGQGSVIGWLSEQIETKRLPAGNGRGIMHHKFMIIGDKYLVTGSYNWSENAELYNYENMMILTDKKTITKFKNEFNKMWNVKN
ncbi:MAG: hypothetical protein A2Y40_06090 [Candidatus Margulisbacteria bacterium GWF2_35_9]|nr:MAG: hypothetical protein A2Y40_06090 [Candidatus Margulisbacteria bacterium GWF2_35_9]